MPPVDLTGCVSFELTHKGLYVHELPVEYQQLLHPFHGGGGGEGGGGGGTAVA
jgi:hypothetical protein